MVRGLFRRRRHDKAVHLDGRIGRQQLDGRVEDLLVDAVFAQRAEEGGNLT